MVEEMSLDKAIEHKKEFKIFEEHGFVNHGTDEYDNDFYIRKELLE